MFTDVTTLIKEGSFERHKTNVFIDWAHNTLDIVRFEDMDAYSAHHNPTYSFQFERFFEDNWCYRLADKNWLTAHDVASVSGAMMAVMKFDFKKPESHSIVEQYKPYSLKWDISNV